MALQRIASLSDFPPHLRGGVVAIGNFDGVHRGHRSVLDKALGIAADMQVPALVLTFEPHPRSLFRPDQPVARLSPAPLRARLLDVLGFDAVVEQRFDQPFAQTSAEDFVSGILTGALAIRHAVTGVDFHFGRERRGGPAFLMTEGERRGFGVTLVDAFRDENADVISSSRIRKLLAEGDVSQAAGLLGYRFTVQAEVTGGKKLGRTLGYPTANMALPPETTLAHGIYAVRFRRADGSLFDGVASFGRRPTVDENGAPLLETFLFDFSGDLYGETASVSFFGFLRGEAKFDDLDALVVQMKRDEAEARALLSRITPMGDLDAALSFLPR